MNSLGERISCYRKKANMTQEQLAEKCGVTAQSVSKWENDLTAPDISLIPRLAELFGVSCDELLGVRRAEVGAIEPELVNLNKMLFKLRILSAEGESVNINFPLSVAEIFIANAKAAKGDTPMGSALKSIDFKQILSLVKLGAVGKLIEVKDNGGTTIEGWVE